LRYPSDLLEGVLLQRRVRFLADIRLDDGREVTAHCVNSGSMRGVILPGQRVRISRAANPKRKLKWTWEHARVGRTWVGVNTAIANPAVGEALERGRIARLTDWPSVTREVRFGRENSRVDFMLEGEGLPRYALEVKNVSMAEGRRGVFPDSVTERGRKHLRELAAEVRAGRRGGVLFFVHRADCDVMIPADAIDPAYGRALRWAARNGVEVMAHRAIVSPKGVRVGPPIEVDLTPGLKGGATWMPPPSPKRARKRRSPST